MFVLHEDSATVDVDDADGVTSAGGHETGGLAGVGRIWLKHHLEHVISYPRVQETLNCLELKCYENFTVNTNITFLAVFDILYLNLAPDNFSTPQYLLTILTERCFHNSVENECKG